MRVIAVVVGAFCALACSATASAAVSPVTVPRPCVAGSCRATLDYVAAPGELASVEVDWVHAGPPQAGFVPDADVRCAAPDAVDALGLPDLGLPEDCTARSPVYDTPGATTAVVRVTVAGVVTALVSTPIDVVQRVAEVPPRDLPSPADPCGGTRAGEQCGPGDGRTTAGGGDKVSHQGWPAITGILWKVVAARGRHQHVGGTGNDELLGHHGDEVLRGGPGRDVLWGDWDPSGNPTTQHDRLYGGAGADWLYSSHGANVLSGGPGRDYVWAYYGHGTIDCGPGFDTVRIRMGAPYVVHNCERVKNFCSFGSKPGNAGGCYKPGERPRRPSGRT